MTATKLIKVTFLAASMLALLVLAACGAARTDTPVAELNTVEVSPMPTSVPTFIPSPDSTSTPTATQMLSATSTETRMPSATPTTAPTATPTPTPGATASLVRDSDLHVGPADEGYESTGALKAGASVTVLAAFGDFAQVQAVDGDDSSIGFVLKQNIDILPSSLAELDVDAVPWLPMDVADRFIDRLAVIKDGIIAVDNSGYDGYYDYHGRPLTMDTAFSITVKLQTADAQYGSFKLQDRPNGVSEIWWQGIRRLDISTDGHYLYLDIKDGVVEASKNIQLRLPDSEALTLSFSDPNGRSFVVRNGQGQEVRSVDVTRLGLQLADGLFPEGTVYLGCVTSPQSKLTISDLSLEKAPSGLAEAAGTAPAPAGLRALAEARGITMGTEFSWAYQRDPRYWEIMNKDFHVAIVSEFSSQGFWQGRGAYNFDWMDPYVDWILRSGWQVRGSHLVWGAYESNAVPEWLLNSDFSRDEYIEILQEHVRIVAGHYKGRVTEWSIANEAASRSFYGSGADFWNDKIGPEYIEIAFRAAREADPEAILIFNDDNNQSPQDERTRWIIDKMYGTVEGLLSKGVPLDVVGMEMHLLLPWNSQTLPEKAAVIETMRRFAQLGVEIYITEFDMNLEAVQGTQQEKWDLEATVYRDMVEACLESGVCKSFSTWGISDSTSWITCTWDWCSVRLENAEPLMFDREFEPKPAYYAVRDALEK